MCGCSGSGANAANGLPPYICQRLGEAELGHESKHQNRMRTSPCILSRELSSSVCACLLLCAHMSRSLQETKHFSSPYDVALPIGAARPGKGEDGFILGMVPGPGFINASSSVSSSQYSRILGTSWGLCPQRGIKPQLCASKSSLIL